MSEGYVWRGVCGAAGGMRDWCLDAMGNEGVMDGEFTA